MIVEDVANMAMMEDELEADQVEPGSCSLWTWRNEDTHMEEPLDDEVSIDTCVSMRLLEDEPYAGKSKISILMQGRILPWMSMKRLCMERQKSLIVV